MVKPLRLSHSAFSTYRHCEQQFKYAYVDNIESTSDKWKSVKDLGTAVHEGIAVLLWTLALNPNIPVSHPTKLDQIDIATTEALTKHDELVEEDKKDWTGEPDLEYTTAMQLNREIIPQLIAMHIPMMEFGTRYRPAMTSEFGLGGDAPIVEYDFEFNNTTEMDNEAPIKGIIDAVLYDMETGQYVLFDWKVRGRLLDPVNAQQDMQLALYATILNAQSKTDARVSQAVMYQILKTLPKPAKILKKGNVSTAKCASHWGYWWNSLPAPQQAKMDHDEWYAIMQDKLRPIESWVSAVSVPITDAVMLEVSVITDQTIDRISASSEFDNWLPSWSAHGCEFCQFKKLCQARRHGLDENHVMKELYRNRE